MLQKLKTVLEDSKNYRFEECVIDSLMRIEDDNFDRCTSACDCYYGEGGFAYIKLCSSLMEEDLREVR